jgi:hypothetical protein
MKTAAFAAAVLAFAACLPAHALVGEEERCIARTPQQIHTWVVNYSNYRNLDDGITMSFPVLGDRRAVDMVRSSEGSANTHDEHGSLGSVGIFMQPMFITDTALFPRFKLQCHSSATAESFTHHCELDRSANPPSPTGPIAVRQNYAVSSFTVDVDAQGQSSACPDGQSHLHYRFTVTTIETHVSAIKDAALRGALGALADTTIITAPLRSFMDRIFGDSFFEWYFREFYRAWANAIPAA